MGIANNTGVGGFFRSYNSAGVYANSTIDHALNAFADDSTKLDLFASGSGRVGFGTTTTTIRGTSGRLRFSDSAVTDAYMLMIDNAPTASGTGATLAAAVNTSAQAGWLWAYVNGVRIYIPYWT